jgi:hypothetical protein
MAFTWDQIVQAEWQDLANEEAHAAATLEQARIVEDVDAIQAAKERIYAVDAKRNSLTARVNRTQQQAQQMPGSDDMTPRDAALARHYGLSARDLSVAKGWTNASDMTDEDKVRTYLQNKQRYRQARADGSYRDDQGTVTR